MSRADLAMAIEAPLGRVRDLELGRADLGYLEGLRLAKAVGICPNCFRRQFEAADARDGIGNVSEGDVPPAPVVETEGDDRE